MTNRPTHTEPTAEPYLQTGNGSSRTREIPGPSPAASSLNFADEIAGIFVRAFNIEAPAPDVDLIAAGLLDSLSIVGLLTELEARFDVRIPLDQVDLEMVRTTGGLQRLIEETQSLNGTQNEFAVVSVLRPGSGRPVFLLHTSWGNVNKEFAPGLKTERPIYAIQADFLRPGVEPPNDLEGLAASYVQEVRQVQPDGPYSLAGFSFGGLVAYEMAVQLHAAGQRVDLLGLVDTQADVAVLSASARLGFRSELAVRRLGRIANPLRLCLNFDKAARRFRTEDHRAHDANDPRLRLGLPEDIRRCERICWALHAKYRPKPYAGDAVLLAATSRSPFETNPRKIWPRKVKGTLRIVSMPGGHRNMTQASWDCAGATLSEFLSESS